MTSYFYEDKEAGPWYGDVRIIFTNPEHTEFRTQYDIKVVKPFEVPTLLKRASERSELETRPKNGQINT